MSQARVDQLRSRDAHVHKVLTEAEAGAKQPIGSLLIKPVQRLCKYPLLFRELLKAEQLVAGRPEALPAMQRAAALVESVVADVNERVRKVWRAMLIVAPSATPRWRIA